MATKEDLASQEPTSQGKEPSEPQDKGEDATQMATAMLETLKGLDVETPQDLQGMHKASQEVGQMANLLGDARQEIQNLKAELAQRDMMVPQTQHTPDYSQPNYEGTSPPAAGPIDEQTLERVILKVVDQSIIRPQRESHAAWLGEMNEIHGDPHFKSMPGLKDAWNEVYNMPETQAQLQTGQARPTQIFADVKMRFMTGMLRNAGNVIERLTGQSVTPAGDLEPQHTEQSTTQATPTMPDIEQKRDQLRQIHQARQDGTIDSDTALQNIVDQFLPEDDPIWRTD